MKRDSTIDNLRGLAMLAMIIVHATSYFLKDSLTLAIWDNLQWAVPVFLFCSFYLYYKNTKSFDRKTVAPYLEKRFGRLLIPYYQFLLVYFPLAYLFIPSKLSMNTVWANIFLYGGLDLNWLPLLFIYLIIIMPLMFIFKNNKLVMVSLFLISLFSSIYFIFSTPFHYRLIMWLPWILMIFFTLFVIKNEDNWRRLFLLAGISFLVFIILRFIEIKIGHNLTHYGNKYPPTLYHQSFGFFSTIILLWLSKKNIFNFLGFEKLLHFLSVNSYSLFLIHNLVIITLVWLKIKFNNWIIFFVAIYFFTTIIQIGLNKIKTQIT
ncbi:MAG: hypothetical protein UR68_C0027G0007 [Candidatus Roizmanbacteria bacterium GW2011_GWA2_35_19]|uniref:Acyltransferase 3 domain-containing protein n=2 Tax=Candidatus Roizmaniibacteriota TaxID=1752723 RepID=A0A0G0EXC2_9BACT|nr:MAG: hypothetical protein UR63_C0043G0011 [Candidatus Roizmanbacteria bacterium GW2011_GWC2_35_12]KKP71772.1 MAG: hypothetical protein UR68_C0027G0007 [Candidatus Roizmanbacteria bacterium GW2011_GWA2_35_19]